MSSVTFTLAKVSDLSNYDSHTPSAKKEKKKEEEKKKKRKQEIISVQCKRDIASLPYTIRI